MEGKRDGRERNVDGDLRLSNILSSASSIRKGIETGSLSKQSNMQNIALYICASRRGSVDSLLSFSQSSPIFRDLS